MINKSSFPTKNPTLWLGSLKSRLTLVLLLSALIPLILIGSLSYYSIFSILENKTKSSMQSNLKQVRISLENTLSNLNYASQQLSYDGRLGKSMNKFLSTTSTYEQQDIGKGIVSEMALLNVSNPNLGVMFYYLTDSSKTLLSSYQFDQDLELSKLPMLASFKDIVYYGPFRTMNPQHNHLVLSVKRKINIPDISDLYVYIETNFALVQNILESGKQSMTSSYAFVDQTGRTAFSEDTEHFPVGSIYKPGVNEAKYKGNYLFDEKSNQGWRIIALIPDAVYNREINKWVALFVGFALVTLLSSLFLAWAAWRTVYKPIISLNKEIKQMGNSDFHTPIHFSGLAEFDNLLTHFQQMRERVWNLLLEVEQNERKKMQLEMEKLLHQINPHFIHNTLDTLKWLARINGQHEMDRLISTLNRLLYYNLGKGGVATIKDELEALKDYMTLQQIRYDFAFQIQIHANEEILLCQIPRFLLQPLVENSLYHGLSDNGTIEVSVEKEPEGGMLIMVSDNGAGMTIDAIHRLLNDETGQNKKVGMGIGVNYVKRMIKFHFGHEATISIDSKIGSHTKIQLRLPVHTNKSNSSQLKERSHD